MTGHQEKEYIVKLYKDWANHFLLKGYQRRELTTPEVKQFKSSSLHLIQNLSTDLSDGLLLSTLIESLTWTRLETSHQFCSNPVSFEEKLNNVSLCLNHLKKLGVDTETLSPTDVVRSDLKSILILIYKLSKYKSNRSRSRSRGGGERLKSPTLVSKSVENLTTVSNQIKMPSKLPQKRDTRIPCPPKYSSTTTLNQKKSSNLDLTNTNPTTTVTTFKKSSTHDLPNLMSSLKPPSSGSNARLSQIGISSNASGFQQQQSINSSSHSKESRTSIPKPPVNPQLRKSLPVPTSSPATPVSSVAYANHSSGRQITSRHPKSKSPSSTSSASSGFCSNYSTSSNSLADINEIKSVSNTKSSCKEDHQVHQVNIHQQQQQQQKLKKRSTGLLPPKIRSVNSKSTDKVDTVLPKAVKTKAISSRIILTTGKPSSTLDKRKSILIEERLENNEINEKAKRKIQEQKKTKDGSLNGSMTISVPMVEEEKKEANVARVSPIRRQVKTKSTADIEEGEKKEDIEIGGSNNKDALHRQLECLLLDDNKQRGSFPSLESIETEKMETKTRQIGNLGIKTGKELEEYRIVSQGTTSVNSCQIEERKIDLNDGHLGRNGGGGHRYPLPTTPSLLLDEEIQLALKNMPKIRSDYKLQMCQESNMRNQQQNPKRVHLIDEAAYSDSECLRNSKSRSNYFPFIPVSRNNNHYQNQHHHMNQNNNHNSRPFPSSNKGGHEEEEDDNNEDDANPLSITSTHNRSSSPSSFNNRITTASSGRNLSTPPPPHQAGNNGSSVNGSGTTTILTTNNASPLNLFRRLSNLGELRGSSASLVSGTSSSSNTTNPNVTEEKQSQEIRRLRSELSVAKERVNSLTTQLNTNVQMVQALEQSLTSLTSRLQQMIISAEQKDREINRLKSTIEMLRRECEESTGNNGRVAAETHMMPLPSNDTCNKAGKRMKEPRSGSNERGEDSGWLRKVLKKHKQKKDLLEECSSRTNGDKLDSPNSRTSSNGDTGSTKADEDEEEVRVEEEDVQHLRKELWEKEKLLTDLRLEALSTRNQMETIKDNMSEMMSQLDSLRKENAILTRHVNPNDSHLC